MTTEGDDRPIGEPREDIPTGQYIEVTEPLRLPPDRNFYDQFPFREVFADIAAQYDGQTPGNPRIENLTLDIGYLVTAIVQSMARTEWSDSRLDLTLTQPDMLKAFLPEKTKGRYPSRPRAEGAVSIAVLPPIMRDVFSRLSRYLGWRDYVAQKLDPSIYNRDGSISKRITQIRSMQAEHYPPTYMAWLTDRQARDARIRQLYRQLVVAEAFPQDLGGQSIAEAVPSGARNATLTWRIRRAAETSG